MTPRPTDVIVGLDVGTTSVKAVAFAPGSTWRHAVIREYPLLQPRPGWQVQDPETILAATADALAGELDPISDGRGSARYKTEMARVSTRRLLDRLLQEAGA